jgi:DNA mismatch repair ATPase MutS
MASPIFSLLLPIIFLIIPLIIIKVKGMEITIEKYIELLKIVFKKHQLGQIFNLSNASIEKMIYVIASGVFYAIQVYQNIMSCRRFYYNMSKIHQQLFTVRDYLEITLENMDVMEKQCSGLKTYAPFIENMQKHRKICTHMLKEFKRVMVNKLSIKKVMQIGHTMKCFYQLYKHEKFHEALNYSFGFNGYLDNLKGVRDNMSKKYIRECKFLVDKKKSKKPITKFVDAYFPTLVHSNPVKNTYKLDKHLLITGPNAAGKTTLLKTTIFNIILSQQIGYGFYKKASIVPYDMIHCYINIPDTSARDSLFQAEAKRCKDILTKIATASESKTELRHFCVFDELYSGTNPYEAISSAYAFLKYLHKYDTVNFVLTTHFLDLCKRLESEKKMNNFHMKIEVLNDDFKYTYKMEKGISDIKGGIKVLKDLEYPNEIIDMTSNTLKELII